MPARKTSDAALATQEKAAAFKQKEKDADVKLRMECARVVVQLQAVRTNADDLTRMSHTLFQYVKTGVPVEKI